MRFRVRRDRRTRVYTVKVIDLITGKTEKMITTDWHRDALDYCLNNMGKDDQLDVQVTI